MDIDIIEVLKKMKTHKNPTFSAIASQILAYDDYSSISIRRIAEDCHISNTTVIRFCSELNIGTFSELKYNLKNIELRNKDIRIRENLVSEEHTKEHLSSMTASLEATRKLINKDDLDKIVEFSLNSEKINIFGIGSTYLICQDLEIKLERLRLFVKSYQDYNLQYFAAKNSNSDTLSIGITYSGKSESVINSLNRAKERGSKTVLITSNENKHFVGEYDIVFFVISNDSRFRHITREARIVMLYVADLILNSIMNYDTELTNKILEETKIYNNKHQ